MKPTSIVTRPRGQQQPSDPPPPETPEDRPEPKRVVRQTPCGKLNADTLDDSTTATPCDEDSGGST